MDIAKDHVVQFHYTLMNDQGERPRACPWGWWPSTLMAHYNDVMMLQLSTGE